MTNMTKYTIGRRQFAKNLATFLAAAAVGESSVVFAQPQLRTYRLWRLYVKNTLAVTAVEDLMREHGVLYRLLLIYEEIASRLTAGKEFAPSALADTADLIRRVVEDYHEKLEEDFVFPHAEKVSELYEIVKVLRAQHQAGRNLTDTIMRLVSQPPPQDPQNQKKLAEYIRLFIRMYRPHAAREDTIIFPAFHDTVTADEYLQLGQQFEAREDQLFGENGFGKIVDQVANLEISLGIYDLTKFTPVTVA